MDSQLFATFISALIPLVAGLIGYAIREFRNRAKPFIAITEIEGGIRKNSGEVDIPTEIVNRLKSSFYIEKLSTVDKLGYVAKASRSCNFVINYVDHFLNYINGINSAIDSGDDEQLQVSIGKLLENQLFQEWIIYLIATNRMTIDNGNLNKSTVPIIPFYESSDDEGCVWIDFLGTPVSFGKKFDILTILRPKTLPFIEQIAYLNKDGLKSTFRQIVTSFTNELAIANYVLPQLIELLYENAQWGFQIYLANLGKNPLLINTKTTIFVEDETGAKYQEDGYMIKFNIESDGSKYPADAISPLIIKDAADDNFAFYTENVQKRMKRGKALRDAYNSKSAKVYLIMYAEKPGLFRNTKIKSPKVKFIESE